MASTKMSITMTMTNDSGMIVKCQLKKYDDYDYD